MDKIEVFVFGMLSHVEVYRQRKVWSRLVDGLFVVES